MEYAVALEKLVEMRTLVFVVVVWPDGKVKLCDARSYVELTAEDLRGAEVRLLRYSRWSAESDRSSP